MTDATLGVYKQSMNAWLLQQHHFWEGLISIFRVACYSLSSHTCILMILQNYNSELKAIIVLLNSSFSQNDIVVTMHSDFSFYTFS